MTKEMFSEKYLTYKVMVFQISYAYLRNIEDAEEATLDSFMKFYKSAKKFQSVNHEKNYLIRVTINTAKDYLKKIKALPLNEEVHGVYDDNGELDKHYVWAVVDELEGKYKDVIYLRYIADLPYKDIASILKISEALARKYHEIAIKTLRKLIGGNYA